MWLRQRQSPALQPRLSQAPGSVVSRRPLNDERLSGELACDLNTVYRSAIPGLDHLKDNMLMFAFGKSNIFRRFRRGLWLGGLSNG